MGCFHRSLFSTYREILKHLLDYAWAKGITSFKRLKVEKYHEARYLSLPSHYIYTARKMDCSTYKSFRRRGWLRSGSRSLRSRP